MLNYYKNYQGRIILISVMAAFIAGIALPGIFRHLAFISAIFINLLKFRALPIIFISMVLAIASLPNPNRLRLLARNTILYIIISEIIALIISSYIFNYADIGSDIKPQTLLNIPEDYKLSLSDVNAEMIFKYVFNSGVYTPLLKFSVMHLVSISIVVGLICAFNRKHTKPLLNLLADMRHIFLHLLNSVMFITPLVIFVLIGGGVADSYQNGALITNLLGLSKFIGLFTLVALIHVLWQLLLVLFIYRDLTLGRIFTEAIPMFITAAISSSSLAAMPPALEMAEKLGGNKKVVEFMLPICAATNLACANMYQLGATLFFLHILGVHIDLAQQILIAIICILSAIFISGVPETRMFSFVIIFNMLHIPLSAVDVLLPLDRVVDRFRTIVNIFSNTCGALIVSKTKLD